MEHVLCAAIKHIAYIYIHVLCTCGAGGGVCGGGRGDNGEVRGKFICVAARIGCRRVYFLRAQTAEGSLSRANSGHPSDVPASAATRGPFLI